MPPPQTGLIRTFRADGRTLRHNQPFVNFGVSQFVFRWGMALAIPLFPIYWVRYLGATDTQISAINATQTFVMMIAYFVWATLARKKSERFVLMLTSFGVSLYPLLTAFTQRPELLVVWAAMAGAFSAGVDLVFFDIVLSTCPEDHQAAYIGMYQTTVYVAAFLAPLVGTALTEVIGIVPTFIFATVLRLVGAGMMARLGVGRGINHGRHGTHGTPFPFCFLFVRVLRVFRGYQARSSMKTPVVAMRLVNLKIARAGPERDTPDG